MKCSEQALRLYAVTDRSWLGSRSLTADVEAALRGGVTMVQLREKALSAPAFLAQARALAPLCKAYGVPLIINDAPEIALQSNADGLHIGQDDIDAAQARRLLGSDKLLGVSVQTVEQAIQAERAGADYLGVGAVFPTVTKSDAAFVPRDTLYEICRAVSIPVCAIGGITAQNLHTLAGTGICGVALVSAIFAAKDIEAECRRLSLLAAQMAAAPIPQPGKVNI